MAGLIVPEGQGRAHVELMQVSKSYGGVRALTAVSLAIKRGSIHALVGENGAGKSTLGKIISGATTPDAGQVMLDGQAIHFHSPRAAIAMRHRRDRTGAVHRAGAHSRRECLPRC